MNKPVLFTVAAIATILGSLSASAQTQSISYTVPLPDVDASLFLDPGSSNDFFQMTVDDIPRFDPALGTLVDVRLSFNYSLSVDIIMAGKGVLDEELPNSIDWSLFQLAVGVVYEATADNPPTFRILGEVDDSVGLNCTGEPFDGFACEEYDFRIYEGGAVDFSLADDILLGDFVGTGFYDGFLFVLDVIGSQLTFDNIDFAFVDLYAFQDSVDTSLTVEYIYTTGFTDTDEDGIEDALDNCIEAANADQTDADEDGYGNACDADVNNDCAVNVLDLNALRQAFFSTDPILDFNNDGIVNVADLTTMRLAFFGTPGPSGPGGACDIGSTGTALAFSRNAATGHYVR